MDGNAPAVQHDAQAAQPIEAPPAGALSQVSGYGLDITEQKSAREAREGALRELERRNAELEDVIARKSVEASQLHAIVNQLRNALSQAEERRRKIERKLKPS